jgi:hypothetical protein
MGEGDREIKKIQKAEDKVSEALLGDAFVKQTGLHLTRDQAHAVADNMVAMGSGEGMNEKQIAESLNHTVKNLNRIVDFMTHPDPEHGSFLDRLSQYDKQMASNLVETLRQTASFTAQLSGDYGQADVTRFLQNAGQVVGDRQN